MLGTFVAVGALHDLYWSAAIAQPVFQGLTTFSVIGALVAAWASSARALRRHAARSPAAPTATGAGAIGARALFWLLAIGCVAWGWA